MENWKSLTIILGILNEIVNIFYFPRFFVLVQNLQFLLEVTSPIILSSTSHIDGLYFINKICSTQYFILIFFLCPY